MISIFSRKNQIKIRQDVLRGVYEENLHILGRGRPALSRRRSFPLKRILLYTVAFLFSVPMHGQYMGTSFSPAELPANISIDPLPTADHSLESTATFEFRSFVNNGNVPLGRMLGLGIRRIMIDPGHGGSASGTIGKMGTMEKDITLDIAKRLKAHLLKSSRYIVRMTREDDSSVPLQKRIALAREAKADLFISIHVNSLPNKPINVIETYYFGPSNDEKTLRKSPGWRMPSI